MGNAGAGNPSAARSVAGATCRMPHVQVGIGIIRINAIPGGGHLAADQFGFGFDVLNISPCLPNRKRRCPSSVRKSNGKQVAPFTARVLTQAVTRVRTFDCPIAA